MSLGRAATGPPVIGGELIVALSMDRALVAVRRTDGDRRWRARLNAPGAGPPLVAGNRVFAASGGRDGQIYGFTIEGRKLWEREVGPVAGALALADSTVVGATEAGLVVALATASGEVRWATRLPQAARAGVVAVDDAVIVASDDSVYRLALDDGAIGIRVAIPGTAVAPAARVGDTLVVATADGQVVALHASDLRRLWSVNVNSPVFGGAAVARDTAYAVTVRGDLWLIPLRRPGSAQAVPVRASVRAPASPVRDGVLIGTLSGEILLVRGETIVRKGRVEGPIEQPVLAADGAMYLVDGRGRMQAWR